MKRKLILILLLLLMAIASLLLLKKKPKAMKTILQGTTVMRSGDITMKVWDYNTVDGDTVSISFDDNIVFDALGLTDSPAIHQFKNLAAGEHFLQVKAINEGMNAPATPHISLTDGKMAAEFDVDSYLDSAGSWKIII